MKLSACPPGTAASPIEHQMSWNGCAGRKARTLGRHVALTVATSPGQPCVLGVHPSVSGPIRRPRRLDSVRNVLDRAGALPVTRSVTAISDAARRGYSGVLETARPAFDA